jgi:formate dehydrogenase major subunit
VSETISFTMDGETVEAQPGETIWQVAQRLGNELPHLCYKPAHGYRGDGNCRACVVEVEGERALTASCIRKVEPGMTVNTSNAKVDASRKMVMELLLADQAEPEFELAHWSGALGVTSSRLPNGGANGQNGAKRGRLDTSHPAIAVDMSKCIHCTLCVRACREVQGNDVIGLAFRGGHAEIVFDMKDPMGESTCVACGECVQACPTGALMPKSVVTGNGALVADKTVDSVCPYCGVGCQVRFHVKDNKIIQVDGRDGPANHNRLCVKGRFGMDYVSHDHRLTQPMIRKEGVAKSAELPEDRDALLAQFRPATWDEALDKAAAGLKRIRDEHGSGALAGFGSAKGSNEEAYLFQKLVRTGFGTNNVDHCTRLCHASSVSALLETIGSGAVTAPVSECMNSDVIVVIGANPAGNHPVAATFIKNAVEQNGATLIVMDPRRKNLAPYATQYLQFKASSDVALLNAILNVIVEEDLVDRQYIQANTEGYEEISRHVRAFTPEKMAAVCGIEADTIRTVARTIAGARAAMIFWGMGIAQHTHGTDNARCLISLALMCGHVGRPGAGLHPLRGQNNVQGASDAGLIPMMYPDYKLVTDEAARLAFEKHWGTPLDPNSGLTVVEIMDAAYDGKIKGMYIMGENPAMSDPDLSHAREGLARLEHLVVQDIFPTETTAFADVILPASSWPEKDGTVTNTDRRVQLGRRALEMPGEARQDLWIIQEIARRIGLDWAYDHPRDVFNEMRACMPSIENITWERLEREGAVTYPCSGDDDPGKEVLFGDRFPTPSGRGKFVPCDVLPANEIPDQDFPLVLTTGRLLEHWHTGAMTRRAGALDDLEPEATVQVAPQDMERLSVAPGEKVRVSTRRGTIELAARRDPALPEGVVFIPFCYEEAAANLLTNPALDPFGKIPELKFSAARLEKVN